MNLGVVVARKADEAAFAGFLGCFKSFNGSAGREDLLHLVHRRDLVNLPEVYIVSIQSPQGFLKVCLCTLARTSRRFRCKEDVFSERRQHLTIDLFRFPLPVNPGVVEVIDAKLVSAQSDGFGVFVAAQGKSAPSLADDRQSLAGLTENTFGNIAPLH